MLIGGKWRKLGSDWLSVSARFGRIASRFCFFIKSRGSSSVGQLIARKAIKLLRRGFWDFRPTEATRCTDEDEIWH